MLSSSSPTAQPSASREHSYHQILTSSALIGGSTIVSIAMGIIRTKAMAAILGPSGFGLAGIYGSIADLAQSVAGMGINSSGVRQIAAAGSGDAERLAVCAAVLRRTSVLLGALGATLLVVFSKQLSDFTFGNRQHSVAICLLGLAVFFRLVSAGQAALIQGLRRISDLAKMNVAGALLGTLVSIPLVYLFGERGVAPSLVIVAAFTIFTSWWYSRKVTIDPPSFAMARAIAETSALLKLGAAFMASGMMTLGVAYAVRVTVLHKVGFAATGLYQSAWALGGLYVGIILQAMGADFYPRLTASANDNAECNRLVNEQALAGLLLAGPGVLATLTFAPLVVTLFYTAKFAPAVELLRWFCLGMTLQVITWPMGFIILAKSKQTVFFCSELAWTVVHIGLAWMCIGAAGLNGAGMAFFGSYVFHSFMIYPIVRCLSGFRWSTANRRTFLFFLSIITGVFCCFYVLPFLAATCIGAIAVIISSAYSMRTFVRLVPWNRIPLPLQRLASAFGFAPCDPSLAG